MTTIADAHAAYISNAGYREENDLTKAQAFATACRQLLVAPSASRARTGAELSFDVKTIREELKMVNAWVAKRNRGGGYRFGGLCGFER